MQMSNDIEKTPEKTIYLEEMSDKKVVEDDQ